MITPRSYLPGATVKKFIMLFGCLCCVLSIDRAQAQTICWIDRVERNSDGVSVYFIQPRIVQFPGRLVSIDPKKGNTENTKAALNVNLGDEFFSTNVPEDSCGMKVVMEGGKVGIRAHASNCLLVQMTGRCQEVSEFIPAQ